MRRFVKTRRVDKDLTSCVMCSRHNICLLVVLSLSWAATGVLYQLLFTLYGNSFKTVLMPKTKNYSMSANILNSARNKKCSADLYSYYPCHNMPRSCAVAGMDFTCTCSSGWRGKTCEVGEWCYLNRCLHGYCVEHKFEVGFISYRIVC